MIDEQRLALFILLGKGASAEIQSQSDVAPSEELNLAEGYDLSTTLPDVARLANESAEAYRLFFVFERYLRDFIVSVLSGADPDGWWDLVPQDVRDEVSRLEEQEETKSWMALGTRGKSELVTYPQLLRIIDHCWKAHFQDLLQDKALVQQARMIGHLRNTVCHMSVVSAEEMERIRQTIRDWFRRVAP